MSAAEDEARLELARIAYGGGEADSAAPLDFLDATRWAGAAVRPREWLLAEWIPMRQTTALYGDGGMGKSLLAQQLGTCVALGRDFMGLPTTGGTAVAIFCEDDDDELHRRQAAINAWLGTGFEDLERWFPVSRAGLDNLLMTFDHGDQGELTEMWARLRKVVEDIRPVVLILDTAADTFGGNENVRGQVRRFIQGALTRLALDFDCAVVLLAHPSVAGLASGTGAGGSTAWSNTVRSRLYLERDEDRTVLTRKKANYAAADETLELHWAEGVFWERGSAQEARNKEERAREVFVACLEDAARDGVNVTANRRGAYAPREFALAPRAKRERLSTRDLEAAMRALVDAGIVVAADAGRDRKRLEIAGHEGGSK